MVNVWNQLTELSYRGFGLKKRKMPREPKNFKNWSDDSKKKWFINNEERIAQQERFDVIFIERETEVIDNMCRNIVQLIDKANSMNPQYLCECDTQRIMQDEAIGFCKNLYRELNHVADTIPCNKNFLTIQTDSINREIELLESWRKSCNKIRNNVIEKEILRYNKIRDKLLL